MRGQVRFSSREVKTMTIPEKYVCLAMTKNNFTELEEM
jgi:hypothetical protein